MAYCESCGKRCEVVLEHFREMHGFKYGPAETWSEEKSECCGAEVSTVCSNDLDSSVHIATKNFARVKKGAVYICEKTSNYRENGPWWVSLSRKQLSNITADELTIARMIRIELNKLLVERGARKLGLVKAVTPSFGEDKSKLYSVYKKCHIRYESDGIAVVPLWHNKIKCYYTDEDVFDKIVDLLVEHTDEKARKSNNIRQSVSAAI
jgi:hypothetical protein